MIKIKHDIPHHDRCITYSSGPGTTYFFVANLDVIGWAISGIQPHFAIGIDCGLQEQLIEIIDLHGDTATGKYTLKKQLFFIQIDCASSHLPPQKRNSFLSTVFSVYLLFQNLMITNANVRLSGIQDDNGPLRGLSGAMGHSMVNGL